MSRHRVLVDIEFVVDDEAFTIAQLFVDEAGVTEANDDTVRDAVSRLVVSADWSSQGLSPVRSVVVTRPPGRGVASRDQPASPVRGHLGDGPMNTG